MSSASRHPRLLNTRARKVKAAQNGHFVVPASPTAVDPNAIEGSGEFPWEQYHPLILAYITLLLALGTDLILLMDIPFLEEGPPLFGGVYLLRTALIAATGGFFVWGVVRLDRYRTAATTEASVPVNPKLSDAALGLDSVLSSRFWSGIVWLAMLLSISFLGLFLLSPRLFHWLAWEDRPVEAASATLYLASAALFILVIRRLWRSQDPISRLQIGVASLLCLGFLLAGFEELSWMQRVFGLQTPAILEFSPREELNLHNLATDFFENLFYFSFFAFAVALPFVNERTRVLDRFPFLRPYAPPAMLAYVAAPAMAFNYDMWNVLLIQLSFFATLAILAYGWARPPKGFERASPQLQILLASYLLIQTLFLVFGDRFWRLWDVTEYKEFLIPFALAIYALEVYRRSQSQPASREAARIASSRLSIYE